MESKSETVSQADTPAGRNFVEMPRPTVAPMVLSLGMVLLAAGAVLGLTFVVVGILVMVAGLSIWVAALLPGQGHFHEPRVATDVLPRPVRTQRPTVEQLRPGLPGYRMRLPEKIHPISAGIKGGLVGGAVMPLPAFLYGLLSNHGIWYPINLLAGMVIPGLVNPSQSAEEQLRYLEGFHAGLLVVAIVIHVVLSVVIGLIYGVLLPTLPSIPRPIAWGGLLMPILWTGVSYVAMHVVNPVLPAKVSWPWFIVSQFVYGITMPAVVLGAKHLRPLLAGAVGGLVGGAAMAVPALLWAAASGHGFWYPVNILAGMVLSGPGTAEPALLGRFHAEWFVVAGIIHAVLSSGFGMLFALLIPRLPPIAAPIAWGGLLLPMVWTGISYSLMGVVNKALQDNVSWPWFIVSQFVFGVAAAVVVLHSQTVSVPPAGPGPDTAANGGGS